MKAKFHFIISSTIMLCLAACANPNQPENPNSDNEGNSIKSGLFSTSPTTRVKFAPGNLQYRASTDTWRFAEHQYDTIGGGNANISSSYDGWIDLFGWGTGDCPTKNGKSNDYGTFVDWGTNKIGSFAANTWRTPSTDEFNYIFFERENASILFGLGKVNDLNGIILLPDIWTNPIDAPFVPFADCDFEEQDGVYSSISHESYDHNKYTISQWQLMEDAGAIFLPAAGIRFDGDFSDFDRWSSYWTSTKDEHGAYRVTFDIWRFGPNTIISCYHGFSVRLVQTIK